MRLLWIVAIALAFPIVPLLLGGFALERRMTEWTARDVTPSVAAWMAFGLLASDILLPVPSSMVMTLAGARLGWWRGAAVCWAGMTVGAMAAFLIARTVGWRIARRLSSERELRNLESAGRRWGAALLVGCRALPILAEASVILAGIEKVPVPTFVAAVGLANLALALLYGLLGEWAADREWLGIALVATGALPLLLTIALRRTTDARAR